MHAGALKKNMKVTYALLSRSNSFLLFPVKKTVFVTALPLGDRALYETFLIQRQTN